MRKSDHIKAQDEAMKIVLYIEDARTVGVGIDVLWQALCL
jgi:hypothetical protein